MTETINYQDTLEITYSVSNETEELEDIIDIKVNDNSKTISDLENKGDKFKKLQKFTWSPDKENVGEIYTFKINGEDLSIKVTDVPVSIVNWDENDLSKFEGDIENLSQNTDSPVLFGNNSVKYNSTSTSGEHIYATKGLRFPEQGQVFRCYSHRDRSGSNTAVGAFQFAVQQNDPTNNYNINIDQRGGNDLQLWKDNENTLLASSEVDSFGDIWIEFEISWYIDGLIEISIYEIDQSTRERESEMTSLSYTDSTYTEGGIGFFRRDDATDYTTWDNVDIIDILN